MKFSLSKSSVERGTEEWSAVAEEARNIFGTAEWLSTWWRFFSRNRQQLTYTCRREDGTLAGIIPLYYWLRRPLGVVRCLGHGPSDILGPVCRPRDRPLLRSALLQLLEAENVSIFVGEELPGDECWEDIGNARVLRRDASPALSLRGVTWESFLASRSRSVRYELGRKTRRLSKDHEIHYRLASEPAEVSQSFDLLLRLHRARWPGGSRFARAEGFHREFAAIAARHGWCRMWFLEIDGVARAAWYGFRFANTESYYQAGRDPSWDRHSLGFLLLMHSIREATSDGVREYRFLRGGEAFKYRLASHDPGLATFALSRTVAGHAAVRSAMKVPRGILRHFAEL